MLPKHGELGFVDIAACVRMMFNCCYCTMLVKNGNSFVRNSSVVLLAVHDLMVTVSRFSSHSLVMVFVSIFYLRRYGVHACQSNAAG